VTHSGEAVKKKSHAQQHPKTNYYFQDPAQAAASILFESQFKRLPPRS